MRNTTTLVHIMTVPQSLSFLRGQVRFMKRHGFTVHAVASPGDELLSFSTQEDVATHGVLMTRRITPVQDLISLLRLIKLLRKLRPDIVHAHTPKGGLLGMIAAFLCKVPVRIYHLHGFRAETERGLRRTILIITERIACSLATAVFSVSPSLRERIVVQNICAADKIRVIMSGSINGVDAAYRFNPGRLSDARYQVRRRFGIPDSATVLGFVGRLVKDKGIVELCEAWTSLSKEFSKLHLLIVGEPESVDPVPVGVLERLHADARVHFTGKVNDVSDYYAAMDVLILPTYREGFPSVLLEAAAMELPVVATRVTGAIDAVVDGVTGTLIAPKDSKALADAVRVYVLNPELARAHGQAGRERVLTQFEPEAIWCALYAEYVHLLATHASPKV